VRERVRDWFWAAGAPARWVALGLIAIYRLTLGALVGGNCRFHPSCSRYAELAIRRVGAVKGSALALWRVLRCSPFSPGGVDYPPVRRAAPVYEAIIHQRDAGAGAV
jgi:putative membrane protein insertion efficiency factor